MNLLKIIWKALDSHKTVIGLVVWKVGEALNEPLLIALGQVLSGAGLAHKGVKIGRTLKEKAK